MKIVVGNDALSVVGLEGSLPWQVLRNIRLPEWLVRMHSIPSINLFLSL